MKQFFKFMFASMLGTILSLLVMIFLMFGIIAAAVSTVGKEKPTSVSDNSVLELKLDKPIKERSSTNPFEDFDFVGFAARNSIGLNDIIANIKKAKTDNHIKGIYLQLSHIPAGMATIEEIRNALIAFKESKKFIVAYGEMYSQGAYYLATAADKIYLNPAGELDFRGLRAEIMFFKGALSKLEVEPEVIRHGKFKSAVEPFLLEKMSDANRKQTSAFVGSIWNYLIKNISESRHIETVRLQTIADSLLTSDPQRALKLQMVDDVVFEDQVNDEIRKRLGLKPNDKINFVNENKYKRVPEIKQSKGLVKDKIAVIYASGEIKSGEGDENSIGSERIVKAIRKARMDDKVKAIVLRVNSPGGSALASDVIWREMVLAKKAKPVVVSMGDVAASGGYYISCAANKIVAEPNTITGSIGVFGLLYNAQKLFNNKLGITIDTLKTAQHADIGTTFRPMTAAEKQIIQNSVERIYASFISKVAVGRKMTVADVDSIGQGRVWSALDAKNIGLVDELGGIEKAIEIAKNLAKLDKYKIFELPEQQDPFKKLLQDWGEEVKVKMFKNNLGEAYGYYEKLGKVLNAKGIQTRMPFDIELY